MNKFIKKFFELEAAGGVVLIVVAVAAMLVANSPVAEHYNFWVEPLSHPINDGLMVIFFLLIGLEIKREMIEGELSTRRKAMLPVIGAIGGVLLPAAIYAFFNWDSKELRGWAIPCATDIAFSLGIIALFGKKVMPSLKIFLMALAVIDDLIAVTIIALFYTAEISIPSLGVALCALLVLWQMNRSGVDTIFPYIMVGGVLWVAILQSGVHATVAGVLLGLVIPASTGKKLIDTLHPWVVFGVMPIFAFANAGVSLAGITMEKLLSPVPFGIAVGLLWGKQLGIFTSVWLAVRLKLAPKPENCSWPEFYAISTIAGIGFTMSLFIGGLAFHEPLLLTEMRIGVLVGSLLSTLMGVLVFWYALRRKRRQVK